MAARCAGLPDGSIRGDTGPGSGSSPRLEHRQLPVPLRTEGTQRRAAFPSYGQGVPRLGDGTVRSCRFLTARCCQLREFGILKKRRLSQRRHLLKAVLPFSADISPRERSAPAPLTGSGPPPRAAFPLHHLTPRLTSPRPRPFRRLPPEAAAVAPSRGAMAARRCPPRPAEPQLRRGPPPRPASLRRHPIRAAAAAGRASPQADGAANLGPPPRWGAAGWRAGGGGGGGGGSSERWRRCGCAICQQPRGVRSAAQSARSGGSARGSPAPCWGCARRRCAAESHRREGRGDVRAGPALRRTGTAGPSHRPGEAGMRGGCRGAVAFFVQPSGGVAVGLPPVTGTVRSPHPPCPVLWGSVGHKGPFQDCGAPGAGDGGGPPTPNPGPGSAGTRRATAAAGPGAGGGGEAVPAEDGSRPRRPPPVARPRCERRERSGRAEGIPVPAGPCRAPPCAAPASRLAAAPPLPCSASPRLLPTRASRPGLFSRDIFSAGESSSEKKK